MALSLVAALSLQAASIVKSTYTLDGEPVALMVYTGANGGRQSDPGPYWKLLGKAPERAYEVKIEADKAGGRTATLKGEIEVSVQIRNKISMGTVKTDTLTLVRDDGGSNRWYLPAKELKRLEALPNKEGKNGAEAGAAPPAGESS